MRLMRCWDSKRVKEEKAQRAVQVLFEQEQRAVAEALERGMLRLMYVYIGKQGGHGVKG